MTRQEIHETVQAFAQGARRAKAAGIDGVELHGANGYLITQFLSSAINDRKDEYGGPIENRARFVIEIVKAIRAKVGKDFHLQMKISAVDHNNALLKLEKPGNTLQESIQVCKWLVDAGVPADKIEGANLPDAKAIKAAVSVPVICTGGFQTASVIRNAITSGSCDAISAARPLVANNDLVKHFANGLDRAPKPCTYCNKCLAHVVEHPLGCYEESRFANRDEMLAQVMSVFSPAPFA
jgi:2,4-dienoyl-CoA reductase-like NADH-dependent reductase (Old Yellow Enzyme family)